MTRNTLPCVTRGLQPALSPEAVQMALLSPVLSTKHIKTSEEKIMCCSQSGSAALIDSTAQEWRLPGGWSPSSGEEWLAFGCWALVLAPCPRRGNRAATARGTLDRLVRREERQRFCARAKSCRSARSRQAEVCCAGGAQ